MARPKKQVITPPVSALPVDQEPAPVEIEIEQEPAPVEREYVLIRSHTMYEYHVGSHVIPSKGDYFLPGDVYRQYAGRPAFDGMFEEGLLEIIK